MHGRSKHINVCFHFLRELTKAGTVELVHSGTRDQLVDVITKPLKLDVFMNLRGLLGVCFEMDINLVHYELMLFKAHVYTINICYPWVEKSK